MIEIKNNTHGVFVTTGASNHALGDREATDYYATDPKALELILPKLDLCQSIWEPACGGGHLSEVLVANGYDVISTDLYDHGYGTAGVDFLSNEMMFDGDIVTNPPYKYAKEFVEKAIETVTAGHKVVMFLRLQFLEGKGRRELFEKYPPLEVWVASGRLNCCSAGDFSEERRKNSSAVAYAWFVWLKGYHGETKLKWFN